MASILFYDGEPARYPPFSPLSNAMFNTAIRQVNAADDSPSLVNSSWLWADDGLTLLVPANETIALRRTIVAPQGKGLKSADIIMTADNAFSLYVDGILIGSTPQGSNPNGWQSGQRFVVGLAGNSSLFAVSALNYPGDGTPDAPGPAGFIGVLTMTYSDGTTATIQTDTSWKLSKTVDEGFQLASTDDSDWGAATSLGLYGVTIPWLDTVQIPALSDATTTTLSATPTSSAPASSTATSTSTTAPTPTKSTPASDTSAKSTSKTPVIAGAVVGGVLLFAITFFLLRFLTVRRRRAFDQSRNVEPFHDGDNTTAQVELRGSSHHQTRPSMSGASSSHITPFKLEQQNPSLSAIPFLQTSSSSDLSPSSPARKAGKVAPSLAPPAAPYTNTTAHRQPQSAESIAALRERIQALEQVMSGGGGPVVEAQMHKMDRYRPNDEDDGTSVPPPYAETTTQHQRGISGGSGSALR